MIYTTHVSRSFSTLDVYGEDSPPPPPGYIFSGFRPPERGEWFLSCCCDDLVDVCHYDFPHNAPRLILEKVKELTELEKKYGEGATVESVWAKQCPNPQDYGKPAFSPAPYAHGWATPSDGFEPGTPILENGGCIRVGLVHAPLLNKWQKIYCESVKDTNDPRMQALLEPDEEFEEEPRVPEEGEHFAGARRSEENPFYRSQVYPRWGPSSFANRLRAIIRKKPAPKERFLKVPLGKAEIVSIQEPNGGLWRIYSYGNITVGGREIGVTIIEE